MAMTRIEIEIKLNRDRAWLLDTLAHLPEQDLTRPATKSEHDPSATWSAKDHLAHLAGIENNFVAMVRRHLHGDPNPVAIRTNPDGSDRSMEQIMATVHEMTERWVAEHRGKSLSEVVALGEAARAATLALISELTDEQLAEKLPGAPWSDGTIGGVLSVNSDHGRMHWQWAKEGLGLQA
jgi:DinB superfamily